LPEGEEILVGSLGLGLICRQSECSAELQVLAVRPRVR
jgi:hypothetical protein